MTNQEMLEEQYKARLLGEMTRHIGRHKAVRMTELFETVFDQAWGDKINDTRKLRKLITIARNEGCPICSKSSKSGGGYYLAVASSELIEYLRDQEHRALKILSRVARIKKLSLPDYLGQIRMNMGQDNG